MPETRVYSAMLTGVDIATRLKLLRDVQGREQREVAKRAGYSVNTLSGLETGRVREPQRTTVAAIAGALGVPREALEDDVACARELLRLMGVPAERLVDEVAAPDVNARLDQIEAEIRRIREASSLGPPAPAPYGPADEKTPASLGGAATEALGKPPASVLGTGRKPSSSGPKDKR